MSQTLDTKKDVKGFINNIIDKNYKKAHGNLSSAVDKKIKREIINNNINLF
tara:strand:- start:1759 stop:1911 length:153 start_codon:yes stop_codon:yes gene_type:complete